MRIDLKNIKEIEEVIILDGTSVEWYGINTLNNMTGYYKRNGCMVGINNEDVREKLASTIFNIIGLPTAQIDLCSDEQGNDCCFSYSVNKENERLVELPVFYKYFDDNYTLHTPNEFNFDEKVYNKIYNDFVSKNKPKVESDDSKVKWYIDNITFRTALLPNIKPEEVSMIRKRIIEIILMDCIIDNTDRKEDNMKAIYNQVTKEYKPPVAYDYGVSFEKNAQQRNGVFFDVRTETVMEIMLKEYQSELYDLIGSIHNNLTAPLIEDLFNNEEFSKLGVTAKQNLLDKINYFNEIVERTGIIIEEGVINDNKSRR